MKKKQKNKKNHTQTSYRTPKNQNSNLKRLKN